MSYTGVFAQTQVHTFKSNTVFAPTLFQQISSNTVFVQTLLHDIASSGVVDGKTFNKNAKSQHCVKVGTCPRVESHIASMDKTAQ